MGLLDLIKPKDDSTKDFLGNVLEAAIRKQVGIPYDVPLQAASDRGHYDYRGFIRAALAGDPRASTAVNPGDNRLHFPDPWKYDDHPTHQWKTLEDYGTQAKYQPLTDEQYKSSFNSYSQFSPTYQKAIQMEGQYPDFGIGGGDSQGLLTSLIFNLAGRNVSTPR